MILRLGDTQEVPDTGIFKWDGHELWVLGDMKYYHGEMYDILTKCGEKFNVKEGGSL